MDLSGLLARAYDFDHVTERRDDEHLDGLRKHRPADDDAWLDIADFQLDSLTRKRSSNERAYCFASATGGDVIIQSFVIGACVADADAKTILGSLAKSTLFPENLQKSSARASLAAPNTIGIERH